MSPFSAQEEPIMSSLPLDAVREPPQADTAAAGVAQINARIDRLPATRTIWTLVLLLALGGWFEFYDLFFTAYVGPGLVKSGLYSTTTASFFGFSGLGAFVAASFAGLFIGTFCLTGLADRYGRRTMFTASLLWYSAATFIMALQTTAPAINVWRLIAGIGVGIELVTIDTYVSELVPKRVRGRAFAFVHLVQYTAVPSVALLAWWLVPRTPLGFDGWRWVVLIGACWKSSRRNTAASCPSPSTTTQTQPHRETKRALPKSGSHRIAAARSRCPSSISFRRSASTASPRGCPRCLSPRA